MGASFCKGGSRAAPYAHGGAAAGSGAPPAPSKVLLGNGHGGEPIFGVCVVGNTSFVTCGDDRGIVLQDWQGVAPGVQTTFTGHTRCVNRVAVRKHKPILASCARDLTVRLWYFDKPEPFATLEGHTLNVSSVAFSPDGLFLCSGSRDTSVRLWDVAANGAAVAQASAPRNLVTCLKWRPGDAHCVVQGSEDLHVRMWDTRSGSTLSLAKTLPGFVYFPLDLDMSADGNYLLASCKGFNSVGCEAKLWDLRMSERVVKEFCGHAQDTVGCRFLPSVPGAPPLVVTASKDNSVRLWNMDSGACVTKHDEPTAGAFTALDVFPEDSPASFVATSFSSQTFVYRVSPDDLSLEAVAQSALAE